MTACPELTSLDLSELAPDVREHAKTCTSCRMVIELLEERRHGLVDREKRAECERFEILLASREDGSIGTSAASLLDEHLRTCAACSAVAGTMAPIDRSAVVGALPAVSTSAYALGREVARGGMGRILAAEDLRIGRPVAVKELLGKSPALAARFEREARVTARLQHPGIVPIYEIGTWPDGTPFYAMRMVEGRTLREAIRDKETLDGRLELLPAVIAAADAVAFAHDKRIIHRDLTPNNILVGAYGDTVVIDWGLAKDLSDAGDDDTAAGPYRDESTVEGLTSAGAVIGTAEYMPPEQARGEVVDERADVYALGAILYHLLASEAPYRASKSDDVLRQLQAAAPCSIANIAPGAPRDLISIVDKAMSRDPANRYADAGKLAAELRRFQTGRVVEAHEYSRRERIRRWVGAHRAGVLASVASLVVLAIVGSIGLVSVLRERDAAEAGERDARRSSTALLEELGRQELLTGDPERAAALFAEAYVNGATSVSLRFMLGSAMRVIEAVEQTLIGDPGPVGHVAFSPDGSRLVAVHATVAEQWTIGGQRLPNLADRGAVLGSVGYSADGNSLITYAADYVRVWNAHSGQLVRRVEVKQVRVAMIADDGHEFLTLDADGIAKRWDTASGIARDERRVAVVGREWDSNTESGYLIAAQHDGNFAIWDWQRAPEPVVADLGWRPASRREVNRDGTRFVGCAYLTTMVWDRDGRLVRTFHQSRPSIACSIDDDAKRVITTEIGGNATIWDLATGDVLSKIPVGDGPAIFVGRLLVTLNGPGSGVEIRDPATGTVLASYSRRAGISPAISRGTDHRLAFALDNGSIELIDVDNNRLRGRFVRGDHPWAKLSSAHGDRLITEEGQTATLWDLQTGRVLATTGLPATLNWSGAYLAGASDDGTVVVLEAKTGKQLAAIPVGRSLISVDLDRDAKRLVACQRGKPCGVWDVQTGARIATTPEIADNAWASLTPDGSRVLEIQPWVPIKIHALDGGGPRKLGDMLFYVAISDDGSRIAWIDAVTNPSMSTGWVLIVADVATGRRLLEVPNGAMTAAFDRSGDLLASFGESGIQLWQVSTGSLLLGIQTMSAPEGLGVALSPDGSLIQTGTGVWSAVDGRRLAVFLTPGAQPHSARRADGSTELLSDPGRAFMTSDGQFGATFSNSTDVTLWDLGLETRSPAEIKRIVDQRVPLRVVDGRLVDKR